MTWKELKEIKRRSAGRNCDGAKVDQSGTLRTCAIV